MQTTYKAAQSRRTGRVGHWAAVAVLAGVAAGLTGCVSAPYPGYGAGYGAGYAAGSSTAYNGGYGTTISGQPYTGGYSSGAGPSYNPGDNGGYTGTNPPQPAPQPYPGYSQYPGAGSTYNDGAPAYLAPASNQYGVVDRIDAVPVQGSPTGVGAVLGGVVGGLLGHQVGGGRGNTVATIGGAVAGALAGNAVESNTAVGQNYRVVLRLNDNSLVTLTQSNPNGLRIGDRARIDNGVAVPY